MSDYALADKEGATPVADGVVYKPDTKQGHKCCGGCCDVRRATIIVNLISIGLGLVGILFLLFAVPAVTSLDADNYDDDEMKQAIYDMEATGFGAGSIALGVSIAAGRVVLNAVGVWGAMKYNHIAVGASMVAYGVEFLFSLITFNIFGLVWNAFFIYPHYFLIQEIRSGVMSEETYEIEKQSCCCV